MLTRAKAIGTGAVVAVFAALVTLWAGGRVVDPNPPQAQLIAGTNFLISSSVTASPGCSGGSVLLDPGVPRCITYTVTNPLADAITVTSIGISVDPSFALPAGCTAADVDLSQAGFSGSLLVAANNGIASVSKTISLKDGGANQNACKSATFHFLYAGSATYTHVYSTSTALGTSGSPSLTGQQVTYTATVTTPSQTPPGPITGAVVFKDGTTAISCETGSTSFNGSTATCKVTYASTAGSPHSITAVFSNSDGNFSGGTSSTVVQVVNVATQSTSTTLTSSLNPSLFGQSVQFKAKVIAGSGTPTGTVSFFDGTSQIGAAETLTTGVATKTISTLMVGTHQIKAVYNGVPGYTTSTSNVVTQVVNYTSCVTSNQNGSLTVASGQAICITNSGKVNNSVTVQSGGLLYINGGSVNGSITAQSGSAVFLAGGSVNGDVVSTGATGFRICDATVNGVVSVSGATAPVVIGDGTSGCGPNTLKNNVTLTNNTAGYQLSGNKINGSVSITGNTGGTGTVAGNTKLNGNLACSGNSPAPTNGGKPNSVSGSRTGQCAGF